MGINTTDGQTEDGQPTYSQDKNLVTLQESTTTAAAPSVRSTNIRFFALFLLAFLIFGNYYCSDLPQSLMQPMKNEMHLENFEYNLIFSVYSIPNIVLPLIGGVLVDYLGERISCICFSLVLILGQCIQTFGAFQKNFYIILVGQFIYACGGDNLQIAQTALVSKWFRGKELAFALSVGLCVGRAGSSLDSFLSPKLYDAEQSLVFPFMVSVGVLLFSLLDACALFVLDKKTDEKEAAREPEKKEEPAQKTTFKDFKNLPRIYFLLVLNCGFLYFGFYGFVNNCSDILIERFGFNAKNAGNIIPIIFMSPVVLSPIIGILVDKIGKRVLIIFLACCIYLVDHVVIATWPDAPKEHPDYSVIGMLAALGLFYSAFAAVFWPCIALSVPPRMTGIAYGAAFVFQNTVLMIGPLLLGKIHDDTKETKGGYFWTQVTLAISTISAMVITAIVYIMDQKAGGKLDKPSQEEKEEEKSLTKPLVESGSETENA